MTDEELNILIRSGEGYNAEFKRAIPSKKREIAEEICAFANAAGGVLLIGVGDDNRVVGTNLTNASRSALQDAIGAIDPTIPVEIEEHQIEGLTVVSIEVKTGTRKPYALSGAIHVRVGPNSQKLTSVEEMREFFQNADRIYFDEAPCPAFDVETEVEETNLAYFREESGFSRAVGNDQLFDNLRLRSPEGPIKNGAVLFFGKKPSDYFEKAIVRCIALDGVTKRFIRDDKTMEGPLVVQYQSAMSWIKDKLNVRYDIEGAGGGPRKEIWEIPETVLKEATINALAHRDYYDRGGVITVELFDDRVEISNPGGLVSVITEREFGKRSHARNPLIFGLFSRMRLVEQIGSGITRINENPAILKKDIEEALGLSATAVDKNLDYLKKLGILERIGTKGGQWSIQFRRPNESE